MTDKGNRLAGGIEKTVDPVDQDIRIEQAVAQIPAQVPAGGFIAQRLEIIDQRLVAAIVPDKAGNDHHWMAISARHPSQPVQLPTEAGPFRQGSGPLTQGQ